MPSHGSVSSINRVRRQSMGRTPSVSVGSHTTPPSTHPRNTVTPAGRAARPLPGLSRRQSRVAKTVLRTGMRRHAPLVDLLAAAETGLVESHFSNLPGGDADSAGWRQERASLYSDPTNVVHSANRFYAEIPDVPGVTAGQIAANVQRPLAAYRPRYQAMKPQARKILRAFLQGG